MKLLVTLEVEVADIPQQEREFMQDGINFALPGEEPDDDDYDAVMALPSLADYSPIDVEEATRDIFNGLGGGDYETQAEMFAGSEVYFYFKEVGVKDVKVIDG